MTPDDLLRVQTQAALLLEDDAFAATFYERLFTAHPELTAIFPADLSAQRAKFSDELSVLVQALRDLPEFERRGRVLGRRHRGYGVTAEHYGMLRDALVEALALHLGEGFTDDDRIAWSRAYNLVGEVMQEGAREHSDPTDRATESSE